MHRSLGLLLLPVLAVSLLAAAVQPPATAPTLAPALPLEEWSKSNNGVQARIMLSRRAGNATNILAYVEFQRVIAHEMSISTHPHLTWSLADSQGHEVPSGKGMKGASGGSGGEFAEQWLTLPPGGSKVSVRVRPTGDFAGDAGTQILALNTQKWEFGGHDANCWALVPGQYVLVGTVSCEKNAEGPTNQWVGKLELPPVRFTVTAP